MKKIKLSEAAKDLKLDNQELIDLLEKYDSVNRKNTTTLSEQEMNYILEYYSQNNIHRPISLKTKTRGINHRHETKGV